MYRITCNIIVNGAVHVVNSENMQPLSANSFQVHVKFGEETSFVGDAIHGRYLQINSFLLKDPILSYIVAITCRMTPTAFFDVDVVYELKHSQLLTSAPTCAVSDLNCLSRRWLRLRLRVASRRQGQGIMGRC